MSTQRINLYRPDRYRSPVRREALLMAGLMALAVVAAGTDAVLGGRRLVPLRAEAAAAEKERAALEAALTQVRGTPVPQADPRLVARRDALAREVAAKRRLTGLLEAGDLPGEGGFSPLLEALARRRVEGVWITRVAARDGGRELDLGGGATAPALLPRWLEGLREEAAFAGRRFGAFEIRRSERNPRRVEFELRTLPPAPDGARE